MDDLDASIRETAIEHVLEHIHDDRLKGHVIGASTTTDGHHIGVEIEPRGFISTAKYALVTVSANGDVLEAEACSGQELRERFND